MVLFLQGHGKILILSPQNYLNLPIYEPKSSHTLQWVSDEYLRSKSISIFHIEYSKDKWRDQQIYKLYAPLLIPNLLNNVLVIDGEVQLRKAITYTTIINSHIVGLYNIGMYNKSIIFRSLINRLIVSNRLFLGRDKGDIRNPDYTTFLKNMLPEIDKAKRVLGGSMIAHHVLIQRDILVSSSSEYKYM